MMDKSDTLCRDNRRRSRVRERRGNGIDYIEVSEDQYQLIVRFLGQAPKRIVKENVRITGGRRITDIKVIAVRLCDRPDPEEDDCLIITVDKPGDFSTYKLCLVDLDEGGRPTERPLFGFDQRYACIDFSFKEGCADHFDCKLSLPCPEASRDEPEINYLAKDYASFRRLILDRLALIMPDWQDRHAPDLGITLVEILAYVGDYLSYYQDAVATEAYLGTARQRISVRRHARLVDYYIHEGCNARTFVTMKTDVDRKVTPASIAFITRSDDPHFPKKPMMTWQELKHVPPHSYEVFEPLVTAPDVPISLYRAHNEIKIYTWGDRACCLPKGATSTSLMDGHCCVDSDDLKETSHDEKEVPRSDSRGATEPDKETRAHCEPIPHPPQYTYERVLNLSPGDIILFKEVIGPGTGNPDDADPAHRHAVRITRVEKRVDLLYHQPVLEVFWAQEDALPFPLCISTMGPPPGCEMLEDVSIAEGNIILVDHGRSVGPEALGCVPVQDTHQVCEGEGFPSYLSLLPGPFAPTLQGVPLTYSEPLVPTDPASVILLQDPHAARPQIRLTSAADPALGTIGIEARFDNALRGLIERNLSASSNRQTVWEAVTDLLSSAASDPHFVVETDNDGRTHLRFGDGELGRSVDAGHCFSATYRIGNGPSGHVGAETLNYIVFDDLEDGTNIRSTNPLAATGGAAAETMSNVKLMAPSAYRRVLRRAVTADDYADIVMRDFGGKIQRAAAALRWTGSFTEVTVAVDPRNAVTADAELLLEIEGRLYTYRRINHDLRVTAACYVPLKLGLDVCVAPDHLRAHVRSALLLRFCNRRLPDGSLGFFHPDALTFGDDIYLSAVVAAAQQLPGVSNVRVTALHRQFEPNNNALISGVLRLDVREIARLDNDPNQLENGELVLNLRGGR